MAHIVRDGGEFDASQEVPVHRFYNADEHAEYGKGGESGTGDWESRFFGLVKRNWHAEESIVRRGANKSVEIDGNSGGDDVCDRRKTPAKLYVALEEQQEEVGGGDDDEDHLGTFWIA